MEKKPLELLVLSVLFVVTGTLGLVDILYLAKPEMTATVIILAFCYGFLQPLAAYALWSIWPYALQAGRAIAITMMVYSFLLYGTLTPVILVANTLLYLYAILYLYRYDIKVIYGED